MDYCNKVTFQEFKERNGYVAWGISFTYTPGRCKPGITKSGWTREFNLGFGSFRIHLVPLRHGYLKLMGVEQASKRYAAIRLRDIQGFARPQDKDNAIFRAWIDSLGFTEVMNDLLEV